LIKAAVGFVIGMLVALSATATTVKIESQSTPQAQYASRKLVTSLSHQGYSMTDTRADVRVALSIDSKLGAEAFSISLERNLLKIDGGDARGLIYGVLAVAEDLENGVALKQIKASQQHPRLELRAIKFNLPWDTYRSSSALDQHRETCRDPKFWEAFLDMMVANRFNTITLWNLHPFTYMIKPTNFPEASPWTPEQFAQWQSLYREIFRMAKERGLDTYIVFWSIFVSREFAEAHSVAKQNFYPNYFVPGRAGAPLLARKRDTGAKRISRSRWHRGVAWRRHGGNDTSTTSGVGR
jgi:hypothetical protein